MGLVESLAGGCLGGGSQRLQVPGLQINEGDKRETVTSVRTRTVWGMAKSAWNRSDIGAMSRRFRR